MGRMATAWFQLVGSQTPLPPQSDTHFYVLASIYPISTVLVMTYHGDLMLAISHG